MAQTKSFRMAPLLITPLYDLESDNRVIHRIVRPRCNDEGEVETVLMRDNGSQRVVVRDRDTVHAFMEVQEASEVLDDKNRMCWANFEDVQHSVFCVLVSPIQVHLWDSTSLLCGGEGMTCHLPFEASSIFPLKTGILVQRRLVGDDQEDDNMVFLSKPIVPPTQLSSLFSLSHPLKTLLPLANSCVQEQLVFVGIAIDKQIAVTFNIELRRHTVWVLESSPTLESSENLVRNWDVESPFVVEESLLRDDGSLYEGLHGPISREEALAEALGVGTRKSVEAVLSSPTKFIIGAAPLCPDLSMTLVYEAFPNNSDISNAIFVAGTFLCINTGTELNIWNFLNSEITHIACLPCTWAIPIQCIPSANFLAETDILVLNSSLQLYRGGRFLADVPLITNDNIVAIHDPVGNQFTLEFQNGTRSRAELSLNLSPLVERVLMTLHAAVGDELALRIRFDCVRLMRDFANSTIHDPPWAALSCVVKQILQSSDEDKTSSEESSSAWHSLLQSGYHSAYDDQFSVLNHELMTSASLRASSIESVSYTTGLSDNAVIRSRIFDAIHLLYEDLKLSMLTKPWCTAIRSLLRSCTSEAMGDFREHYAKDDEILGQAFTNQFFRQMGRRTTFAFPPCIMTWIMQSLNGCSETHEWIKSSLVASTCPRLTLVHRVYSILASNSSGSIEFWRDEAIVNVILASGLNNSHFLQNDFPIGVALPLLDVLARCRCHPCNGELSNLAGKAWKVIGREDLLKQSQLSERVDQSEEERMKSIDDDHDGLAGIEASHHLRFPDDNRLKEVARLLRSSRPTFLKVPRAVELSDHDYERLKQEKLLTLCRRVLALPLGRGMFTLGTLNPVPAEQLPIPELCLSGRVPPANNTLALDASHTALDMTVWPNFHNGVAAGLRLPHAGEISSSFKITRSWIMYNKASCAHGETPELGKQLTHAHGGLLMALGLRGHLSALSMTDIYEYLTQGSVTTSVGVLLGMAANKRGTCDPSVSKMLCLHIPSLLPLSFSSIDVAAPAHAAAVTGIGLLYQGSSHRLMSEFLLNEMARRPVNEASTIDREAYALSCGLALGMISLAKGGSGGNAGLVDLEIEERLYRYVVGGVDERANRRRQDIADRRLNTNGTAVGESERCARVHEGETINNDVTAPGALLALGLMYMKSSNKAVAAGLALPDTHFLLEYSRPDTLMLRVLARSLILWDNIEPTNVWIEKQIPSVVLSAYLTMQSTAEKAADKVLGMIDQSSDDSASRSNQSTNVLKGSQRLRMQNGVPNYTAERSSESFEVDFDVDRQTVRQMHAYIVTGSCFAIGLRFAGTADAQAASAITKILLEMKSFRDTADPVPVALRPHQPIVGMCLGLCAVSLALVMAGTGDLDTLRLFKMIRWRSDEGVRHGAHMAVSAAIGLLFLGGGMYTIGRSPEDIAAIVTSFFPRFPMDSTDNKYHLQALRHMYVLAARQRYVEAFDIDTHERVSVLVQARFNDTNFQPIQLTTPNLLRNTDYRVVEMVVKSETYFPSRLSFHSDSARGVDIYVKRRPARVDECYSVHSFLRFATSGSKHTHALLEQQRGTIECSERECGCPRSGQRFCTDRVFGCISATLSPPSLPVLAIMGSLESKRATCLAWDAGLLQYYLERFGGTTPNNSLIEPDFTALITEKVKRLVGPAHPWRSNFHGNCSDKMDTSM